MKISLNRIATWHQVGFNEVEGMEAQKKEEGLLNLFLHVCYRFFTVANESE